MKIWKKAAALTLAALAVQGGIAPTAYGATAPASFVDAPSSHWAHQYVARAAEKGWVSGIGNGRYNPSGTVSAAEFLSMVTRAFYADEIPENNGGAWYMPYWKVAEENDLLFNTNISLDNIIIPLNRFDMASIAAMSLTYKGVSISSEGRESTIARIPDWSSVPHQYRLDIPLVVSCGVLNGVDSKGTFAGERRVDRAQAAVVLIKMNDVLESHGASSQTTADPVTPAETVSRIESVTAAEPVEPVLPEERTDTSPISVAASPSVTGSLSNTSRDDFSEEYKSSKYYRQLQEVVLTGDYRKDILAVAVSQIGYSEGNQEDQIDGSYGGEGNCTEYGRYLGSNGSAWCSEFASWCARMAGIPTDILKNSWSANADNFGATYYSWSETVYAGGNYTPRPGDLALFAWDGTSQTEKNLSHTAIVKNVNVSENTITITVIDGNSNGTVREHSHKINSLDGHMKRGYLVYFVAPEYD